MSIYIKESKTVAKKKRKLGNDHRNERQKKKAKEEKTLSNQNETKEVRYKYVHNYSSRNCFRGVLPKSDFSVSAPTALLCAQKLNLKCKEAGIKLPHPQVGFPNQGVNRFRSFFLVL